MAGALVGLIAAVFGLMVVAAIVVPTTVLLVKDNPGTLAPTTAVPSSAPTLAPTTLPTVAPTSAPTTRPTVAPTAAP